MSDIKKEAMQYAAFMTDIAEVMIKHKVENLVAIFGMNGKLRNSYIPLKEELPLYCNISDAFNEWLKQGIVEQNIKP